MELVFPEVDNSRQSKAHQLLQHVSGLFGVVEGGSFLDELGLNGEDGGKHDFEVVELFLDCTLLFRGCVGDEETSPDFSFFSKFGRVG